MPDAASVPEASSSVGPRREPTEGREVPQGQRARDNNTRRFTRARLPSLYGYEAMPHAINGLGYRLPHSVLYTGRLIRIASRAWEVWSPNSKRAPFYPGKASADYDQRILGGPEERRTDGHLGRFDHTVSPQESGPIWWSFIMRRIPGVGLIHQFPKFDKVYAKWVDEPYPSTNTGRLEEEFLARLINRNCWADKTMEEKGEVANSNPGAWEDRPVYPSRTVDTGGALRVSSTTRQDGSDRARVYY
jgi:hypothetical protein